MNQAIRDIYISHLKYRIELKMGYNCILLGAACGCCKDTYNKYIIDKGNIFYGETIRIIQEVEWQINLLIPK